jgi:hypothetical protein
VRVAILGPLRTGARAVGGGRLRALLARLSLDIVSAGTKADRLVRPIRSRTRAAGPATS